MEIARHSRDGRIDRHRLRAGVFVSHVRGRGVRHSDRLDGADADGPAQGRRVPEVRLPVPGERERRGTERGSRSTAVGYASPACARCATTCCRCGPDLTCRQRARARAGKHSRCSPRTTAIEFWSTSICTRSPIRSAGTSSCSSIPGDAKVNYIKRLVGLPGETLRIYQGDIFIGPAGAKKDEDFKIERKPPDKVLVDAAARARYGSRSGRAGCGRLAAAVARRRRATPTVGSWKRRSTATKFANATASMQPVTPQPGCDTSISCRPTTFGSKWRRAKGGQQVPFAGLDRSQWRRLITDSNPYNGRVDRNKMPYFNKLQVAPTREGIHWVGDLMLEADVRGGIRRGRIAARSGSRRTALSVARLI